MNKILALFRSHSYISNVLGYTTLFASADLIQQGVLGGELSSSSSSSQLREDTSEQQVSITSGGPGAGQSQCHIQKDYDEKDTSEETFKNVQRNSIDWGQTARIALIGLCFHSNFNYHWLRALERAFPGGGTKRISVKVILDQLIAAPATISAFYIGLSTLEGKKDPFEDWRNKFWTSYKFICKLIDELKHIKRVDLIKVFLNNTKHQRIRGKTKIVVWRTGIVYWSIMQAVNFSLVPPVARTVYVGGISLGWTIFLCHFRQQKHEPHSNVST